MNNFTLESTASNRQFYTNRNVFTFFPRREKPESDIWRKNCPLDNRMCHLVHWTVKLIIICTLQLYQLLFRGVSILGDVTCVTVAIDWVIWTERVRLSMDYWVVTVKALASELLLLTCWCPQWQEPLKECECDLSLFVSRHTPFLSRRPWRLLPQVKMNNKLPLMVCLSCSDASELMKYERRKMFSLSWFLLNFGLFWGSCWKDICVIR